IAVIGLITALLGRMMGDIGRWGNFVIAGIFFLIGLHLLDIIPLPLPGLSKQPQFQKKGLLTGFLLGLIFGIALGPCTFAYMAPMLGVVFDASRTNFIFGLSLLFFYGLGHCSVIVFAGTFTEIIRRFLKWNEKSKGTVIVKRICGVLVILCGIYMIITNL
ncbi:MAG TPA: cytochrome C biogenesis protein, partial [Firmicutes bacterium]|nr:cytochrome C biogenesis protein [Bacillota bacterium]